MDNQLTKPSQDSQLIQELENNLVTANSSEEVKHFLSIYQEAIAYNELIQNYHNQQFIERFQIIRQTAMWGIFLSIGVALIISRLTIPGFILIGVVFYDFVLDYRNSRSI